LGPRTLCLRIRRVLSSFFRHGQVLETFRGKGIYQPAVDVVIQKLDQGEWVHLFSEGYVTQADYSSPEYVDGRLRRFKWGIGRMIMETSQPPLVIPVWLSGFDKLMPEGRRFPFKLLPRFGAELSVTFGEPVPPERILAVLRRNAVGDSNANRINGQQLDNEDEIRNTRIAVTDVVQKAVEALGRGVIRNIRSSIQ